MTVTVVGLGKIGLPLAALVARSGVTTYGVDNDAAHVQALSAGHPVLAGEPGLTDILSEVIPSGLLVPTTDLGLAVSRSDVVLVVVPLVVDAHREPRYEVIDAVTAVIADALRPDTLVVYETTLPVGVTRKRLLPVLSRHGRTLGHDLFLAYSPERVSSGSVLRDLRRYPKLVGGADPVSASRAVAFYRSFLVFDERPDLAEHNDVWDMGSSEAAEFVKLAETAYRDLNIAFANELATQATRLGLDLGRTIDAANSQPYSHIHRPGLVGGHCIPVYPWFLLAGAPELRLTRTAREVNSAMPAFVLDELTHEVGELTGARVAVLGLAYRAGVRESAFSGAIALVEQLRARDAVPMVHDPLWTPDEFARLGLRSYELGTTCDYAVVQCGHPHYRQLSPADLPGVRAIYDIPDVTPPDGWGTVRRLVLGRARGAGGTT